MTFPTRFSKVKLNSSHYSTEKPRMWSRVSSAKVAHCFMVISCLRYCWMKFLLEIPAKLFCHFSGLISLYFMCQTWKHCWRISILCKTAEFPSCHNKIEDYSWQATLFPPRMICIIVWIKFDNWKEWMVKSSLAKIKLF